jgi:myosin-5
MYTAKKLYHELRTNKAALTIQRVYRGHKARSFKRKSLHSIIVIQSLVRRRKAIKELKGLRIEARSVSHLKEKSANLENKVSELTRILDKQVFDNKMLLERFTQLEKASSGSKKTTSDLQNRIKELEAQLDSERKSKAKQQESATTLVKDLELRENTLRNLQAENQAVRAKLQAIESLKSKPIVVEMAVQVDFTTESLAHLREENEKLKGQIIKLTSELSSLNTAISIQPRAQRPTFEGNSLKQALQEEFKEPSNNSHQPESIKPKAASDQNITSMTAEEDEVTVLKKAKSAAVMKSEMDDSDDNALAESLGRSKPRPGSVQLPLAPPAAAQALGKSQRSSMFELSRGGKNSVIIDNVAVPILSHFGGFTAHHANIRKVNTIFFTPMLAA